MSWRTVFSGPGGKFELIDFAPRFSLYQRFSQAHHAHSHPAAALGRAPCPRALPPDLRVGLAETGSWRASNHIAYTGFPVPVRLAATNVPLTYVLEDEQPRCLLKGLPATSFSRSASRSRQASRRPQSASSSAHSTTGAAG